MNFNYDITFYISNYKQATPPRNIQWSQNRYTDYQTERNNLYRNQ